MQKKEGIKPAWGASKKCLRSHLLECQKMSFWDIGQTLDSSQVIPNVIYYIVLYSMNI